MARYKHIDTGPRFLAVDLERQLLPGSFEHALHHLIDHEIDLTGFNRVVFIPTSVVEIQQVYSQDVASMVIDLSQVNYFGSVFLSFLLRCHTRAKKQGSEIVLAGASERTRELLHLTALDTLCTLYDTREEAMEALGGSD